MTNKTWTATITDIVTRPEGAARVSVPRGNYAMYENEAGEYVLNREGIPTFVLTAIEISTYINTGALRTSSH